MDGYYKEIVEEIEDAVVDRRYDEAYLLLQKELSMPYIPRDVEERLLALQKEVNANRSLYRVRGEKPLEELLQGLHGREKKQLESCSLLIDRNLRVCIDEIKDYLEKDPFPEAAALLVNAVAEQRIEEDFTWNKNGVEYCFDGDSVIPVLESKGFVVSYEMLEDLVSSYPSVLKVAKQLLFHDAMLYLPLSYEESEVEYLVTDVVSTACDMLQDDVTKEELLVIIAKHFRN